MSHGSRSRAALILAASSTLAETSSYPAFVRWRSNNFESRSESSTLSSLSVLSIGILSSGWSNHVGKQPIESQLLCGFKKVVEINGLADITIGAEIIAFY